MQVYKKNTLKQQTKCKTFIRKQNKENDNQLFISINLTQKLTFTLTIDPVHLLGHLLKLNH